MTIDSVSLNVSLFLTHICLASTYDALANSAVPDQAPQNVASDQVLQFSLTE